MWYDSETVSERICCKDSERERERRVYLLLGVDRIAIYKHLAKGELLQQQCIQTLTCQSAFQNLNILRQAEN